MTKETKKRPHIQDMTSEEIMHYYGMSNGEIKCHVWTNEGIAGLLVALHHRLARKAEGE